MAHTPKPGRDTGRVAIIEIAATKHSPAVMAVEVVLNGGTLTISDQGHNLTEEVRDMAHQLIALVQRTINNGSNH